MKGPFATMFAAFAAAVPGEAVMARDSAKHREAGWCVMPMDAALREFNSPASEWTIWEVVQPFSGGEAS